MNHTTNLHLPQFEETDRIHHDDFNDAFDKIDTAVANGLKLVTGTWTGDGARTRTIDLGCTPKLLLSLGRYLSNSATVVSVPGLSYLYRSDSIIDGTSKFVLSGSTVTITESDCLNGENRVATFIALC